MKLNYSLLSGFLILIILFGACHKSPSLSTEPLSDFTFSHSGQYIIYRLDSTVFINYGTQKTVNSYLLKDVADTIITDNLGRKGWRVFRYITDTAMQTGWQSQETYFVTTSQSTMEVDENNLRFIKLATPVSYGFSWLGNTYLPYNPLQDSYQYNTADNLDWSGWNYTYQNINDTLSYNGTVYDSTVTVLQVNDSTNSSSVSSRTYWIEKYGRHVGLLYKEIQMWEYQASYTVSGCYYVNCPSNCSDTIDCTLHPSQCDSIGNLPVTQQQQWIEHCRDSTLTGYYYTGYGIKMTILSHS